MTIPAPNLANVYQVRLEGTYIGEPCANVLAVADLLGTQSVEDVADNFAAALTTELGTATGTAYRNVVSNGRTYTGLHVVAYDADNPFVTDKALVGATMTGASAGHGLPYQLAVCVSLTTGLASRRKRGRLFDYGFTESNNDATGRIDNTARTAIENFWLQMGAELVANDLGWGILSRGWINEGPGDTRPSFDQSFSLITGWSVRDTFWDTMRSRVPS